MLHVDGILGTGECRRLNQHRCQTAAYTFSRRVWPADERINPAHDTRRPHRRFASVRTRRGVARSARAPFRCLSEAETCFCLLGGPLQLAHARRARGAWAIGLGLVQVVALAGVLSLRSQVVEIPGGHGLN